MKPFLELPIIIENAEGNSKEVVARIQPSQIDYYYPGFFMGTIVVMNSGSSHLTPYAAQDIDTALQLYDTTVKANAGKFGNISLKEKPKSTLHVPN